MKSHLIPTLTFFLCVNVQAQKYADNDCSLKALTNNCTEFGKNNEPSVHPWTENEVANPFAGSTYQGMGQPPTSQDVRKNTNGTYGGSYGSYGTYMAVDSAHMEKMQQISLEAQTELIENLPGSSRFKLALTGGMNLFSLASLSSFSEGPNRSQMVAAIRLSVPWPANDPKAKIKTIDYATFEEE